MKSNFHLRKTDDCRSKVSEECFCDELQSTSVPRLPLNSSSTSLSNVTPDPLLPFPIPPSIPKRKLLKSASRKKGFFSLTLSPSPPSVSGPQYPEKVLVVDQGSTSGTGESLKTDACGSPLQSPSESGGERTALEEMWPTVIVVHNSTEEALHPQMTADEKVSEKGVQDELPCTSVPKLHPNSSSPSPSNKAPNPWRPSLHYSEQLQMGDPMCSLKGKSVPKLPPYSSSTAPSSVWNKSDKAPDPWLHSLQFRKVHMGDLMSAPKHKRVRRPLSNSSSTSPSSSSRSMTIVPELVSSGFCSFFDRSTCSQSFIPSVAGSQYPDKIRNRGSSCLIRSPSVPSLSLTPSAKNQTFTRSKSLPVMLLKSSCGSFTLDITAEEHEESYRFQCSCPGLYQCSVTGLVFHMEAEGDVVYRIVPWKWRLLAQCHKQPAGPLFDIKCLQQCVRQLHLPHCEIRSTGGCEFLSVAHVNDEGVEIIAPHEITETHVVINITGFSAFGIVKDEDSPPDPVRALVLLFYRTPAAPDLEYLLNVLLLPKNVVLRDVLRKRKELHRDEIYIETPPQCKLHPKQEYSLSTCPQDDSVLVQPTTAELDYDNYDNYFPSFQVSWETMRKRMKLCLRDTRSQDIVWERLICFSCGPSAQKLPPCEMLLYIWSNFIDRISGPVLQSLLDKLFEKKVITDSERESAEEMRNNRDKARFVIDTVRKKGEAASSEMMEFLCELDLFLCEHLGLI